MGAGAALVGAQVIGGALANRKSKKQSKWNQKVAQRRSQYYQALTSPEYYNQLANQYRGQYQNAYLPQMRQLGDVLGLNEANAQEQFAADTARRGLSGSGVAMAGANSLRAARMAGLGEAQRAYTMDVENATRQQVQNQIAQQLHGAEAMSPYQYDEVPPSMLQSLLGAIPAGLQQSAAYGQYTGSSGNFGSLLGLKGGPLPPDQYGPYQPYYIGNQPGRG